MSPPLEWLRSLVPITAVVAIIMWIGFAASSVIKLMAGSFARVQTADDVILVLAAFVFLPLVAGFLCAIFVDACVRVISRFKGLR